MPRVAGAVIPSCPRHVTQRGTNRQDGFFVEDDRRAYPDILAEQCERLGLAIEGCCLGRKGQGPFLPQIALLAGASRA